MGTQTLLYAADARKLVFGSTLDAISAHPHADAQIRRQAIYDYVHFHIIPSPETVYVDRHRLAPGSYVVWDGGQCRSALYWTVQFTERADVPFAALKEAF